MSHEDVLLVKQAFGYVRSADDPAFTVTGSPLRYGTSGSTTQRFENTMLAKMQQADLSKWEIPEDLNIIETQELRLVAQCFPVGFGEVITHQSLYSTELNIDDPCVVSLFNQPHGTCYMYLHAM